MWPTAAVVACGLRTQNAAQLTRFLSDLTQKIFQLNTLAVQKNGGALNFVHFFLRLIFTQDTPGSVPYKGVFFVFFQVKKRTNKIRILLILFFLNFSYVTLIL